MRTLRRALPALLLLLCAGAASGVIIDSGDGTGNTGAPTPDPGWDNVGLRGTSLTGVYLGQGWVLTANHVGPGPLVLGGTTYQPVPGTDTRLSNPDGSPADLVMFAISPVPPLPGLPIAATTPPLGSDVLMIGNGRDRSAATSWDPNGPPPPAPIGGYLWDTTRTLRWGTGRIEAIPVDPVLDTFAIGTSFDADATPHEGMAADGDSGGALFANDGSGSWELAGILFAIATYEGQPADTALYGNVTYAADLAVYRDDILDVMSMPEPTGALPLSALLVIGLARRRRAHPRDR